MTSNVIRLFIGLLLIALGIYGLGFGLSVFSAEFTAAIIIVFGSMLAAGLALYLKVAVKGILKRKEQSKK